MLIQGQNSRIEIVAAPDDRTTFGREFTVQFASLNFAGKASFAGNASVSIDRDDLRAFVQQLRQLEANRQSTAAVKALSPEEFQLHIKSMDTRGHMAVTGLLGAWEHDSPYFHSVEFGFEFDPTTLPGIVADCAEWVAPEG